MNTRMRVDIYVDEITEDNFDELSNCLDTMHELGMIDWDDNCDIYNKALTYSHGLPEYTGEVINQNGDFVNMRIAYKSMNKEIRDIVDDTIGEIYCIDVDDKEFMQDYFNEYCKIHLEKYGKEFKFNRTVKERELKFYKIEEIEEKTNTILSQVHNHYAYKYNVVAKESGFVIADDCTFTEAMVIVREMEIIDIKDGTFEPDFYEIVEAATN